MKQFRGRVAVITGAASGIGRSLATSMCHGGNADRSCRHRRRITLVS
nr:hypothetical protein [Brevibacillus laterosporus]